MINRTVGRMEEEATLKEVIEYMSVGTPTLFESGKSSEKEFHVTVIPNSQNHDGKPMLYIGCGDKGDIDLACIEVSEEGVFSYFVDDGAS
jgi:hypothetical protein